MLVTMTRVVDAIGWRDAYVVLAVFMFAIIVPVALVMRRSEDYGLLPDGATPGADGGRSSEAARVQARDAANSYTRGEALRTPAIWLLVVGFGFNMMALSAVLVHAIPFMTDNGFTRTEVALCGCRQWRREPLLKVCVRLLPAACTCALSFDYHAVDLGHQRGAHAGLGTHRLVRADVLRVLLLGIRIRRVGTFGRVHLGQILRQSAHRGRARSGHTVHHRVRGIGPHPSRILFRRSRFIYRRIRRVRRCLPHGRAGDSCTREPPPKQIPDEERM